MDNGMDLIKNKVKVILINGNDGEISLMRKIADRSKQKELFAP